MTTLRGLALVGLILPAFAIGCTKQYTIYWDNLQDKNIKIMMDYSTMPEDSTSGILDVPPSPVGGDVVKVSQRVKFKTEDLPVNVTCRVWTGAGQPDIPPTVFQITDKTKDNIYMHIPPSNPGQPLKFVGPMDDEGSAHIKRDASKTNIPQGSGTVLTPG